MNNKNSIAAFLAIMAMFGFLIMFAALGFLPVPPGNKDFFNMGFIALIGFVGTAFGYYLGSSQGSAQKNDLLAQVVAPQAEPAGLLVPALGEGGFIRLQILPLLLLLILGAFALLPGCATMQKDGTQITAGKSLLAVKSTIVTAATTADALCKTQQLSAETCTKAKGAYDLAKPAYDSAVDAYLLMSQGGDPAPFGAALTRVQGIAANMLQLTGGAL